MICLINRDAVLRALIDCDLDPSLRVLIASRLRRLQTTSPSEDIKVVVVEGGDTAEMINEAVGFPLTGDDPEESIYEWIELHGLWFEVAYLRNGGPRLFIFVENSPATELGIHYRCLAHFWSDDDGIGQ